MDRQQLTLDEMAEAAVRYLREQQAVRINEDQVDCFVTVFEICDHLKIDRTRWTKVKNRAIELGHSVCFISGRGHFLGGKDEVVTNYVHKYQVAKGWVKHLHSTREAIEKSSPAAREWIKRRYKNFDIDEELRVNAERPVRA